MTEQEFNQKWNETSRGADFVENLTDEQFVEFKNDCFELYETYGFTERFNSPYDDEGEHNGMKFEVVRRAKPYNWDVPDGEDKGEVDIENLPVWLVRFENGDEAYCYPEEIALLEARPIRKEPLKVGDLVFDTNVRYWGHIAEIKDGQFRIVMTDADERENRLMLDCELEESETEWTTSDDKALYQVAEGLYDREGNVVCIEHNKTRDGYPYYSPNLDENLFKFETFTKEELEK